jgi:hypothetical protein
VRLTFALSVGKVGDGYIQKTELDPMEAALSARLNELEEVRSEDKFFFHKQSITLSSNSKNHQTVLYAVIFETLVICGITYYQLSYIKNMFTKRVLL